MTESCGGSVSDSHAVAICPEEPAEQAAAQPSAIHGIMRRVSHAVAICPEERAGRRVVDEPNSRLDGALQKNIDMISYDFI